MSEDQITILHRKHEMLAETVGELETAKELHSQRLGQHDTFFQSLNTKLDMIVNEYHQRSGAEKANARQLWLAFSLIGLLFTAINLYMGAQ